MKETQNRVGLAASAANAPPLALLFADIERVALPTEADNDADKMWATVADTTNETPTIDADADNLPTPTRRQFADIPFEIVEPTPRRQPPTIIYKTVIIRENPPYFPPPPTAYADTPTANYTGIGTAVANATGVALRLTFEVTAGLFCGILVFLAQFLAALFGGSREATSSYDTRPNLHKLPSIKQGGSVNTVRDINIHVHVGDNNQVNVKH